MIVERRSGDDSNAAGWVLAVVLIVAVLLAAFWLAQRNGVPAVPNTGSPNINVTVPGTGSDSGGSGSGTTGGSGSGSTGGTTQ